MKAPLPPEDKARARVERTKKEDKKASLSYKPSDASDKVISLVPGTCVACLVGGGGYYAYRQHDGLHLESLL
jgi:hypothetical protein